MNSLNFQLGLLAGDVIYQKYLPTLSTDMLQSPTIIQVTDVDDLEKHARFQKLFDESTGNRDKFIAVHKEWLEFYKPMSKKYLPKTLVCQIEKINPSDLELFRKGLDTYLWNTDLSHYKTLPGFFLQNGKYSWCSVIILTRDDNQ